MNKFLTSALLGSIVAAATLVALVVLLWPTGWLVGALIALLGILLLAATSAHVLKRRRHQPEWDFRPRDSRNMTDAQLAEWRNRALIEREQRLELRELQLARHIRALQLANEDYLDILESNPSRQELEALVEIDRKLLALIEEESQGAFERILENRYASKNGVNTELILTDIRSFVERVALLYRPDTEHPLFETDIELIAKSLSSTALHMLVVIDDLPLNLKSYNTAKMYRLLQRGATYYGNYKTYRPYIEHGMNLLHVTRLAFSLNPAAAGAAWAAGKLTTYGARAIGERLLQRRALQLLNDFIRVIGYEAATMYGGDFRHRDANWVFGAALVNLEISRGKDTNGRDAALVKLCNLSLRHEFDRVRLLNHLAKHKPIEVKSSRTRILMTRKERKEAADLLATHCRKTGIAFDTDQFSAWRISTEEWLDIELDLPVRAEQPRPRRRLRRFFTRSSARQSRPSD